MALSRLQIHHVRNLQHVDLQDLGQINVFSGPNGAGKTSILESIHLLGLARSFRGTSVKPLISHGQAEATVFGVISEPESSNIPLGVQRSRDGEIHIKVGGSPVRRVTELIEHLPLQVINADSFALLTGSPKARRQYIDWGVFHVEHRFFDAWRRYQRCIKQRNKLLRRGRIPRQELDVWTRDLVTSGTAIDDYRQAYFGQLVPRFKALIDQLAPALAGLELRYRRGWDRQMSFSDALENTLDADQEQGYTHIGPQRADVRALIDGHVAAETLSRGQQKLVVCAMKLAQGQLMAEMGRGACAYLVDDLPSELDEEHNRRVCELLGGMGAQVFITCVDKDEVSQVWPAEIDPLVFHVEQGVVSRQIETQSDQSQ
jgi:DNA replication and repair protein RecF